MLYYTTYSKKNQVFKKSKERQKIMIYTLTLNPSLDVFARTEKEIAKGKTNRIEDIHMVSGGKGLNVSFILKNIGVESSPVCFTAGETGEKIKNDIIKKGLTERFIFNIAGGNSRINLKICEAANIETEINGEGPKFENSDIENLLNTFNNVKKDDIVVLSGSVPKSIDVDIYSKIIDIANQKGATAILDTSGKALENSISHKPFLIKPNRAEAEEITKIKIESFSDASNALDILQSMGAKNVIISLGSKGAVISTETKKKYISVIPSGKFINSVGSGDSMIAGFVAKYSQIKDVKESFLLASAMGTATAYSESLAEKEMIEDILKKVNIKAYTNL